MPDLTPQSDYLWILLPEIVLSLWAMLVLMVDVFQKGSRSEPSRPVVAWLALGLRRRRDRQRVADRAR